MKLGEILVKKGLLTPSQLHEALQSQLFFGGHLGTSLIETGYIDESTLGEALEGATGVPHASKELLEHIRPTTIKMVPRRIAEEYQAVPFKIEGNAIHVAFVNPRDLRSVDVLRFTTGRKVVAWIAPEVRIFQALERHYGVERRPRYIRLDHKLAGGTNAKKTLGARIKAAPAVPAEDPGYLSSPEPESAFGYGRPWQEVAEELSRRDLPERAPRRALMPLAELAERYCRAESRDDLARATLDFSTGRARRMLLMFVRKNWASVWMERGFSLADPARSDLKLDVTSDPLFGALMGSDHYRGPLPSGDGTRSLYETLSVPAPAELLIVPVHVNDNLIAAALADGGPNGSIDGDIDDFLKAFRLLSTGVVMVALQKKLRDIARLMVPAEAC